MRDAAFRAKRFGVVAIDSTDTNGIPGYVKHGSCGTGNTTAKEVEVGDPWVYCVVGLDRSCSDPAAFGVASQWQVAVVTEVCLRPLHCEAGGSGSSALSALCQARASVEATLNGRVSKAAPLGMPVVRHRQMKSIKE